MKEFNSLDEDRDNKNKYKVYKVPLVFIYFIFFNQSENDDKEYENPYSLYRYLESIRNYMQYL